MIQTKERGRRRRDRGENRARGDSGTRRENGKQKLAQVRCTDRRFTRKSDGNFENSGEMIIFEHGRTSLKYMRGQTTGHERSGTSTIRASEHYRCERGMTLDECSVWGADQMDRDGQTWWQGGGLHAQRVYGPYSV